MVAHAVSDARPLRRLGCRASPPLERAARQVDDDTTELVAMDGPCIASTAKEEPQDGAPTYSQTLARQESGRLGVRQWSCQSRRRSSVASCGHRTRPCYTWCRQRGRSRTTPRCTKESAVAGIGAQPQLDPTLTCGRSFWDKGLARCSDFRTSRPIEPRRRWTPHEAMRWQRRSPTVRRTRRQSWARGCHATVREVLRYFAQFFPQLAEQRG